MTSQPKASSKRTPVGKLVVAGFTCVNAPSREHPAVPYYVALLKDADGAFYAKKTFTEPKLGASMALDSAEGRFNTVGVVGTGVMGAGIAALLLEHGLEVIVKARSPESAQRAANEVNAQLEKRLSPEKLGQALAKLKTTLEYSGLARCGVVIESVAENLAVKQEVFQSLDEALPQNIILATNTSSLSIKEISAGCKHRERIAGMHFFNPVPRMQLVEVVAGKDTNRDAVDAIAELSQQLGKTPLVVKDTPAFIVNRLLMPFLNDAIRLVEDGVAEPKDIDSAARLGLNHPMGPLALVDLIGVDVFVEIMRELERQSGDSLFAPRPLALRMLSQGKLGRKTGAGFYEYDARRQ